MATNLTVEVFRETGTLENHLVEHPAVREAAVIAVPDPTWDADVAMGFGAGSRGLMVDMFTHDPGC
ncbi:AMP-binding enzyme [Nocardia tengchongensis]|uniref:AMP-binding enzyme n=1 Tax=Nocardia tengchongensis TaxID=2055889 RepID=UPI00361FA4C5